MALFDSKFRQRFWDVLCGYERLFVQVFVVELLFLVLLVYAFFNIESSPATRVVLYIDFVVVIVTAVGLLGVVYRCRRDT